MQPNGKITNTPPVSTYDQKYGNRQIAVDNRLASNLTKITNPDTGRPYLAKFDGNLNSGDTVAAIINFQYNNKLHTDGLIGVKPYGETGPAIEKALGRQERSVYSAPLPAGALPDDRSAAALPAQAPAGGLLRTETKRTSYPPTDAEMGGGSPATATPSGVSPVLQQALQAREAQGAAFTSPKSITDNAVPLTGGGVAPGQATAGPDSYFKQALEAQSLAPSVTGAPGRTGEPVAPAPVAAAGRATLAGTPTPTDYLRSAATTGAVGSPDPSRVAPAATPPVAAASPPAAAPAAPQTSETLTGAQQQARYGLPTPAGSAVPAQQGDSGQRAFMSAVMSGDPAAMKATYQNVWGTDELTKLYAGLSPENQNVVKANLANNHDKIGMAPAAYAAFEKMVGPIGPSQVAMPPPRPSTPAAGALAQAAQATPQPAGPVPASSANDVKAKKPTAPPAAPAAAPGQAGAPPSPAAPAMSMLPPPTPPAGALSAADSLAKGGPVLAAPAAQSGAVTPAILAQFKKAEGTPAGVTSSAGAVSEYQITPATAKTYGLDEHRIATDPAYAQQAATTILSDLSRRFGGNTTDMAVAYNAGPQFAASWVAAGRPMGVSNNPARGIPQETHQYLARGGFPAPGTQTASAAGPSSGSQPTAAPAPLSAPMQQAVAASSGGPGTFGARFTPPGAGATGGMPALFNAIQPGGLAGPTPAPPPQPRTPASQAMKTAALAGGGTNPASARVGWPGAGQPAAAPQGALAAASRFNDANFSSPSFTETGMTPAEVQSAGQPAAFAQWQQENPGGTQADYQRYRDAQAAAAKPAGPQQEISARPGDVQSITEGAPAPAAPAVALSPADHAMDMLGLPRINQGGKDQSRAPNEPPNAQGRPALTSDAGGAKPIKIAGEDLQSYGFPAGTPPSGVLSPGTTSQRETPAATPPAFAEFMRNHQSEMEGQPGGPGRVLNVGRPANQPAELFGAPGSAGMGGAEVRQDNESNAFANGQRDIPSSDRELHGLPQPFNAPGYGPVDQGNKNNNAFPPGYFQKAATGNIASASPSDTGGGPGGEHAAALGQLKTAFAGAPPEAQQKIVDHVAMLNDVATKVAQAKDPQEKTQAWDHAINQLASAGLMSPQERDQHLGKPDDKMVQDALAMGEALRELQMAA